MTRKKKESAESAHEHGYTEGHRMAWQGLLQLAVGHLLGDGVDRNDPHFALGVVTLQLEQARAALRSVCADHGDNDWSDNLHLGDVIEKHLARHLG